MAEDTEYNRTGKSGPMYIETYCRKCYFPVYLPVPSRVVRCKKCGFPMNYTVFQKYWTRDVLAVGAECAVKGVILALTVFLMWRAVMDWRYSGTYSGWFIAIPIFMAKGAWDTVTGFTEKDTGFRAGVFWGVFFAAGGAFLYWLFSGRFFIESVLILAAAVMTGILLFLLSRLLNRWRAGYIQLKQKRSVISHLKERNADSRSRPGWRTVKQRRAAAMRITALIASTAAFCLVCITAYGNIILNTETEKHSNETEEQSVEVTCDCPYIFLNRPLVRRLITDKEVIVKAENGGWGTCSEIEFIDWWPGAIQLEFSFLRTQFDVGEYGGVLNEALVPFRDSTAVKIVRVYTDFKIMHQGRERELWVLKVILSYPKYERDGDLLIKNIIAKFHENMGLLEGCCIAKPPFYRAEHRQEIAASFNMDKIFQQAKGDGWRDCTYRGIGHWQSGAMHFDFSFLSRDYPEDQWLYLLDGFLRKGLVVVQNSSFTFFSELPLKYDTGFFSLEVILPYPGDDAGALKLANELVESMHSQGGLIEGCYIKDAGSKVEHPYEKNIWWQ